MSDILVSALNRIVQTMNLGALQPNNIQDAISRGADPALLIFDFGLSAGGLPQVSFTGDIGPDFTLSTHVDLSLDSDENIKVRVSYAAGNGSVSDCLACLSSHSSVLASVSQAETILRQALVSLHTNVTYTSAHRMRGILLACEDRARDNWRLAKNI